MDIKTENTILILKKLPEAGEGLLAFVRGYFLTDAAAGF